MLLASTSATPTPASGSSTATSSSPSSAHRDRPRPHLGRVRGAAARAVRAERPRRGRASPPRSSRAVVPPVQFPVEELCRRYLKREPAGGRPRHQDRHADPLREPARGRRRPHRQRASPPTSATTRACIVVDFGTATTFDAVTPKGEYLGGVDRAGHHDQRRRPLPPRRQAAARRHRAPEERHRQEHRRLDAAPAWSSATSGWSTGS